VSKRKEVWQVHHIAYDPEWTVAVRKSEHWVITQLSRFAALSPGAKQAIRILLEQKPDKVKASSAQ
jgi:hypothetical protein